MTLFDTSAPAAAPLDLPAPQRERFQPLRAGIQNLWWYDEQEFWFRGGRMILRGVNESGKSKALELLMPFLLDANLRPERLDPFGERAKTMAWNLTEFHPDPDRKTAIGYVWMEFGRLLPDGRTATFTIGAGMRGTRGSSSVTVWYWTSHGRVGRDFELVERLHDRRIPLPRDALRTALGDTGQVYETAEQYRDAVDKELFALGRDRYGALVNLLLQLRRPQLSARLEPAELARMLSASLPPLDEARIHQLSEAFDRLEADAEELRRIDAARAAIATFRGVYSSYARQRARRQAQDVRSAFTRLDDVTRTVRRAEATLADAASAVERIAGEITETERAEAGLRGALDGVNRSDAMKAAGSLRDLEQRVEADRRAADHARNALGVATSDEERARDDADRAAREARASAERFAASDASAAQCAGTAGLPTEHDVHRERFRAAPGEARAALDAVCARRIDTIRKVQSLAAVADGTAQTLREVRRTADDARRRLEAAQTRARDAETAAGRSAATFEEAVDRWCAAPAAGVGIRVPETGFAAAARERVVAGVPARQIADEVAREAFADVAAARAEAIAERRRVTSERRTLAERRREIEAERDDAPPPRAGRSRTRDTSRGDALWRLSEFEPHVSEAERASIEAALDASGMLDAWVTSSGDVLADGPAGTSDDTWMRAADAPAGPRTLRDVLRPVSGLAVSEDVVQRVLWGVPVVAAGEASSDAPAWIALDGRWRAGPVSGRWAKPSAEHVGAAARAAARARRLAEIDAALRALGGDLARIAADVARLDARDVALRGAVEAFPAERDLLRALAASIAASAAAAVAVEDVQSADREVASAERRHDDATRRLQKAAETAGLLGHLDDLGGLTDRVHAYRRAISDLAAAAAQCSERESADATAQSRLGERVARASAAREHHAGADIEASRSAAEFAALRDTVGAAVEEVLRRRADLELAITAATDRGRRLVKDREASASQRAVAESQLAAAEEARGLREGDRAAAVDGFERVGATEILTLAIPGHEIPAAPWNLTTALDLARAVESATPDASVEQDALDRGESRVQEALRTLQTDLGGDYDTSGSREGGCLVVTVRHDGRMRRILEIEGGLAAESAKRMDLLGQHERDLIERHLLGEVGHHLQSRIVAARDLVEEMNRQLRGHPTNSGLTIRLRWTPADDPDGRVRSAISVLGRDVRVLAPPDRESLVRFLRERIAEARAAEGGAGTAERMSRALDYRLWHEFSVYVADATRERRLTVREHATGSGGSRAVIVHLPLFAAAKAHYRSAAPHAPHLVLLDEAFAGIDAAQRGSCMGLLVSFDLDFLLTNHEEWGCYAELPEVATYHLERDRMRGGGVAAVRFVWNGEERREDDPFLESRTQEGR